MADEVVVLPWLSGQRPIDETAPAAGAPAAPVDMSLWAGQQPVEEQPRAVPPPPIPPPPLNNWRRLPQMYGSAALEGGAEGVGGLSTLSNMVNPITRLESAGLKAASPYVPETLRSPYDWLRGAVDDPGKNLLLDPLRSLGLIDRPELAPQGTGEKYAVAGVKGAAEAAPSMFMGGAGGLLGRAAQTVAQGVGGGLAKQGATDLLKPDPNVDPGFIGRMMQQYGPQAAQVVGSLGAGLGYGAGRKIAGAGAGQTTPLMDAYQNLDITPRLVGDVAGGPAARTLQSTLKIMPGGVGPLHRAAEETVDDFGRAVERTADMLGSSRTLQQAGHAMQLEGDQYLGRFRTGNRANWADVDMQIPARTPTPLTKYETALQQVRTDMPGAPATAKVLEPTMTGRLLNALTSDTRIAPRDTGVLNAQGQPIMTPAGTKPLTWQDAQGIRRQIGERLADPATYLDPGSAKLSQLYKALSADQEALAASQGPAAQAAFNTARDFTRSGHEFIETTLSKISRGNVIDPEQAAQNVLGTAGGGGSMLERLRANMPRAADELAAHKLRDMALARGNQQNATGTRVSPVTFSTDATKLSPEAHTALYGGNPAVAQRIADLRTVGTTMKNTEALSNTSRTAGAEEWMKLLETIPAGLVGYHAGGMPWGLAAAVVPPAIGMAGGHLMANPAIARFAANPGLGGQVPKRFPAGVGAIPGLLGF